MAEDILMIRIHPKLKHLLRLRAAQQMTTMSALAAHFVGIVLGSPSPEEAVLLAPADDQMLPVARADAPAQGK